MVPPAKLPGQWSSKDLRFFRVSFRDQLRPKFFRDGEEFGNPNQESLAGFLVHETETGATRDDPLANVLLYLLRMAHDHESYVVNLTHELLLLLEYKIGLGLMMLYGPIGKYQMCRKRKIKVDAMITLVGNAPAPLFIAQCKTPSSKINMEPQIIAQAVAVFQVLQQANPDIQGIQLPCITMCGSFPTFYKIPITAALSNAVQYGRKPPEDTVVNRYIPLPQHQRDAGMDILLNRQKLLQDLLAFKSFIQYPHAQPQVQGEEEDGEEEEIRFDE